MAGAFAVAQIVQVAKTIEWGARIRDLGLQFGEHRLRRAEMDYAFANGTDARLHCMRKMAINASIAMNPLLAP